MYVEKSCSKQFCTKNVHVKCWWNWHQDYYINRRLYSNKNLICWYVKTKNNITVNSDRGTPFLHQHNKKGLAGRIKRKNVSAGRNRRLKVHLYYKNSSFNNNLSNFNHALGRVFVTPGLDSKILWINKDVSLGRIIKKKKMVKNNFEFLPIHNSLLDFLTNPSCQPQSLFFQWKKIRKALYFLVQHNSSTLISLEY